MGGSSGGAERLIARGNSLKITFLLTQSLESPSGLGRYWPIAKELRRLGHQVTILALHHNLRDLSERRYTLEGVEVWYVGQMHVRKIDDTKLYFGPLALIWVVIRSTLGLLWGALHVPSDVYHVGKPHLMNGLAGLIAGRLRRTPLYLDCDDYEAGSNRFSGAWQRWVVALFEDQMPKLARGVTTNTRFTATRLLQLGVPPDRIVLVPNGVDRDRFGAPDPVRVERLRRDLGISDELVVLYVGTMSLVSHAVDLLIDALPMVRASCDGTVLVLVGGGEDLEALKERATRLGVGSSARFLGRVPPDQISAYYSLANIVVDPVNDDLTARARSPLKIVEGLVCGIPVVTGDTGDRREMLLDGKLGFVAVPGSAADLGHQIVLLLQDEGVRARMSSAAMMLRERWCWDQLVQSFVLVYDHH